MRFVQMLRNDHVIRALRPFWGSSRVQNFGGSSRVVKNPVESDPDPYEGNFSFTECDQYTKVTVIGAAGRVGRTLSLLLKTCPLVDHLCLFDTDKAVKGIGVDISHVDTKCCVSHVCGMRNIQQALDGPDVVIIAAGCPTSPQLKGKKLFDKNAPIIAGLSEACARFCPKACVVLVTSPINSLLPVMGEVYQIITNKIPERKLFGLTTLDVVRANTFVGEVIRKDPNSIIVPVVGGTSQDTIVPVFSQMKPCSKIKQGEIIALTECLKRAEGNLADCQNCGTRGASSLSTAYAAFRFTSSLVMALKGAENIIECAYVKSDIIPELEYLASPLKLGVRGVEHNFGYPPLSDYEVSLMEQAAPALINDIEMGKCFVVQNKKKQDKYFRRCSTCCKKESFFNLCSNTPREYCSINILNEEDPNSLTLPRKFDERIKKGDETKQPAKEEQEQEEEGVDEVKKRESAVMAVAERNFFPNTIWINEGDPNAWKCNDDDNKEGNANTSKQDSGMEEDESKPITRKCLLMKQLKEAKDSVRNLDKVSINLTQKANHS